jgi:hypothetical protein
MAVDPLTLAVRIAWKLRDSPRPAGVVYVDGNRARGGLGRLVELCLRAWRGRETDAGRSFDFTKSHASDAPGSRSPRGARCVAYRGAARTTVLVALPIRSSAVLA